MLSTNWLRASAPVGVLQPDNRWAAFGTCVFFHTPPILWMVTANHVVKKVGRDAFTVLVTRSPGKGFIVVEVGKIMSEHSFAWVEDSVNDLAATPMPEFPEYDITAVTAEDCLPLVELVPSMQCFTVGCPYGLHGVNPQSAIPLVLDGVISGVDPENRKIYTSAPTFPGNSGGPLIAFRSPFNASGGITVGRFIHLLAGIMLETKLLHDPNSRVPPLHLGVAAPADAVLSLLGSEPARAITARIEALQRG
jgi:hypothetical protein